MKGMRHGRVLAGLALSLAMLAACAPGGMRVEERNTRTGDKIIITPFLGAGPAYNQGYRDEKKRLRHEDDMEQLRHAQEKAVHDARRGVIEPTGFHGKFYQDYQRVFEQEERRWQRMERREDRAQDAEEYRRGAEAYRNGL